MPAAGSPGQVPMLLRTSLVQQGGEPGRPAAPNGWSSPAGTCRAAFSRRQALWQFRFCAARPALRQMRQKGCGFLHCRRSRTAHPPRATAFSLRRRRQALLPDEVEMPRFPPAAPEMHRASTNTSSVAACRRAKTAAPVGAAVFSFSSQLARGCSARHVMRSSVGSSSASTMPFPAQMASRSGSVPNTNTGE